MKNVVPTKSWSPEDSLNEALAKNGYRTRPRQGGTGYAKDILDEAGEVAFTGSAHEVWDWLRSVS